MKYGLVGPDVIPGKLTAAKNAEEKKPNEQEDKKDSAGSSFLCLLCIHFEFFCIVV